MSENPSPEISTGSVSDIDLPQPGSRAIPRGRRRKMIWMTTAFVLAAFGLSAAVLLGGIRPADLTPGIVTDETPDVAEETRPTVKVIRPKRDPNVEVSLEQLASVEAFYQSALRARVSGIVRAVYKDINDRVSAGEVLIEIDVPDLEVEVGQKESMVRQRLQELQVARAKRKDAEAAREVARTVVRQKKSEVKAAEFTRDFRQGRLKRYRALARKEAIPDDVVEEQEFNARAAEAAVEAAGVAVERAEADLTEAGVKVEAATAEINLREEIVTVARKELDKARAQLGYTRITAPFDGVISRRNVDPGSFVQNASTGQSETLITIERTDLVTVVAKFPDNAASFVTRNAPVEISIDEIAGLTLSARVTRFSPSIQATDRTMRVEVDLFNDEALRYRELTCSTLGAYLAALSSHTVLERALYAQGRWASTHGRSKGPDDLFPVRAGGSAYQGPWKELRAGMTGTMKLRLGRMADCHVLPASAVFSRGGKPYILLVQDGVTRQVPVRLQVNDGKIAVVGLVIRSTGPDGGTREMVQDLTGKEEIVPTRQLELGDGLPVKTALAAW